MRRRPAVPNATASPQKSRRPRGLVARSNQWAKEHADELSAVSREFLDGQASSPFRELISEAAIQYKNGELLDLAPPIVRRLSSTDPGRFGVFHPRTERDPFIEALLGRPVPKRPRYLPDRPAVTARLRSPAELMDSLGPAIPEASGLSPREQVALGGERLAETIDYYAEDPALGRTATALMRDNPEAFVSTPLGEWLLQLQTDVIARDAARPPFLFEFVTVFEVAPGVTFGIAWWDPADVGARQHRAKVAAYLRYLFDYRVAPWNRWSDVRSRREALRLSARRQGETIGALAERVRTSHAEDYPAESGRVTLARLYRINRMLR